MWCHLLLLLPVLGLGLFFLLPRPIALVGNALLTAVVAWLPVLSVRALKSPVSTGRHGLVGQVAVREAKTPP